MSQLAKINETDIDIITNDQIEGILNELENCESPFLIISTVLNKFSLVFKHIHGLNLKLSDQILIFGKIINKLLYHLVSKAKLIEDEDKKLLEDELHKKIEELD